MRLTSKCEYALLALLHIARNEKNGLVPASHIATAQGIPRKFLEQILLLLKRSGFVKSAKGSGGGFRLARPAAQISLAAVIRSLDGALAPTESVSRYFYEATPIEREAGLVKIFKDIRNYISDRLEKTTLADLSLGKSKHRKGFHDV